MWHPSEPYTLANGTTAYGWRAHDDFTVPEPAEISSLALQMVVGYSNRMGVNPRNPTNELPIESWDVSIWSDLDGQPSPDRIYQTTIPGADVSAARRGVFCRGCQDGTFTNWTLYEFSTDLPTPFYAAPHNSYWLSVVPKTTAAQPGISWISSGSTSNPWSQDTLHQDGTSDERFDPLDFGASDYRDRAFRLEGEWLPEPSLPGDFDGSGILDGADIDALTRQSADGANRLHYDLNADLLVNGADIDVWVQELFHSWIGDADVNGEFNSSDLVVVLAAGTYEVDVDAAWSTGDFNGDGRANTTDLVAALAAGGYEVGPRAAASAVPEPLNASLLTAPMVALALRHRSKRRSVVRGSR
jgi:hypothetical protein